MADLLNILLWAVVAYFIYRFIRWLRARQTRYIPKEVKRAVIKHYYGMCAVCPDTISELFEFHHRKNFSDGGDNSEKNIVPLCPKHHAMVTRYG